MEEEHKYMIYGSAYIGNERFRDISCTVVAHSRGEADNIAFQESVIPTKIKDLGKVVREQIKI